MMKLLVGVFMIRMIIALISGKTKESKENKQENDEQTDAKHPAAFQVR